ncbi:unnamed protein product [Citrullus colocynthis]|uniref:Uncharacterized protein n=1 Tax=Citrullus colocynthis TaxID=252529 RepID=A0ABP0XQJ7_9ROSI
MEPNPTAFSPGSSRAGLLLQSLVDDLNLKKLGSCLLLLHGEPGEVFIPCLQEWNVHKFCFEYDTEPSLLSSLKLGDSFVNIELRDARVTRYSSFWAERKKEEISTA